MNRVRSIPLRRCSSLRVSLISTPLREPEHKLAEVKPHTIPIALRHGIEQRHNLAQRRVQVRAHLYLVVARKARIHGAHEVPRLVQGADEGHERGFGLVGSGVSPVDLGGGCGADVGEERGESCTQARNVRRE